MKLDPRPDVLYIVLEGKYTGRGVEYHDAVLLLQNHMAIIVENEMSGTTREQFITNRIQKTLESTKGVRYNNDGGNLEVHTANTKYAVQLRLAKHGDSDGTGVLWWLAQGDRGPCILPSAAFTRPRLTKNWNVILENITNNTVKCRYIRKSGEVRSTHERERRIKIEKPMCYTGLAAVHAAARFTHDDDGTAGVCALCGVPVARAATCLSELELIAAAEGQPTRDPLSRRAYTAAVAGFGPSALCAQCGGECAKLPSYVDAGTRAWKTVLGMEGEHNTENGTKLARKLFPRDIPFIERLSVCTDVREGTGRRRRYAIVLAQCPFEPLRSVYIPQGSLHGFDLDNDIPSVSFEERRTNNAPYARLKALNQELRPVLGYIQSYPCISAMLKSTMEEPFTEYQVHNNNVYQAGAFLYVSGQETWHTPNRNEAKKKIRVGLRVREKPATPQGSILYVEKIFRNKQGEPTRVKLDYVGNIASRDRAPAQGTRSTHRTVSNPQIEFLTFDYFYDKYELHDSSEDVGDLYQLYRDQDDAKRRILGAKSAHEKLKSNYVEQHKSVHVLFVHIDQTRDVYALPRPGGLQRVLRSLWVNRKQKSHRVAMQLRVMGHLAFSYIQPRLKRVWHIQDVNLLRNNFLYYVWDLYVSSEAAKQERSEAFTDMLNHIFPQHASRPDALQAQGSAWSDEREDVNKAPKEQVNDIIERLEIKLGPMGGLVTELMKRARRIDAHVAGNINTIQPPDLALEARLIGENVRAYDMHKRGLRGLLLQTAAALTGNTVLYEEIERLRDVAPLLRAFDD